MRRVVPALAAILALTMAPMQSALLALGDVQVTLTCSDGIQIFDTTLVVDAETLTALQSAVEAITLYPAGLVCQLTQAPLLSGFVAVAFADSPKDFAVGGVQVGGCYTATIGFSAHSQADGSAPYGSIAETIPEGQCIDPGHYKAKVTCLVVSGNTATFTGQIQEASGFYGPNGGAGCGPNGCNWVQLSVQDNGNPVLGVSPDAIGGAAIFSPTNPGCVFQGFQATPKNGNIVVHDAP